MRWHFQHFWPGSQFLRALFLQIIIKGKTVDVVFRRQSHFPETLLYLCPHKDHCGFSACSSSSVWPEASGIKITGKNIFRTEPFLQSPLSLSLPDLFILLMDCSQRDYPSSRPFLFCSLADERVNGSGAEKALGQLRRQMPKISLCAGAKSRETQQLCRRVRKRGFYCRGTGGGAKCFFIIAIPSGLGI